MAGSALFLADFTSCRGADRKQYCVSIGGAVSPLADGGLDGEIGDAGT
jgi:hypothetical protein